MYRFFLAVLFSLSLKAETKETLWSHEKYVSNAFGKIGTDCVDSEKCFHGLTDKWNNALMVFQPPLNISKYDSIEFYFKVSNENANPKIGFHAWPSNSKILNIKDYAKEPSITKFQRVSIPVKDFLLDGLNIAKINYFIFLRSDDPKNAFTYDIDNFKGVTPVEEMPPMDDVSKYLKLRFEKKTSFGCKPGDTTCKGPLSYSACASGSIEWPLNSKNGASTSLKFVNNREPYLNKAGYDAIKKVNELNRGLRLERFRSFDAQVTASSTAPQTGYYKAHSSINPLSFPGIEVLNELPEMDRQCKIEWDIYQKKLVQRCGFSSNGNGKEKDYCLNVFDPKVNWMVRSLGVPTTKFGAGNTGSTNVIDYFEKERIRGRYYKSLTDPQISPPVFSDTVIRNNAEANEGQDLFKKFYENNIIFITPGIRSSRFGDIFSILSPFYITSFGNSGSDAALMYPILIASASIKTDLKKKIMDSKMLAPTISYLFRNNFTGNYTEPGSHASSYLLGSEAASSTVTLLPGQTRDQAFAALPLKPAPFLDRIVKEASELTHIPPVARLKIHDLKITENPKRYFIPNYNQDNTYSFTAVLRQGESLEMVVDLYDSWTDGKEIKNYGHVLLRGLGEIKKLNADGSILKITIPYMKKDKEVETRTDILLYVNDGSYNSAPAYISVKHLQAFEEQYYFK